jgi:hypothetical protein
MTSNILLLASKICFLASQELVGAGMNCRALLQREEIFLKSSNQKQKLHVAPCLLTDWDEMCNHSRGHSIDASCEASFHLAKWLQRRRFLEINQLETRITCGGHVC